MDRLDAISLFAKVVETGSFSEAGRQSNLAPSSVSRQIGDLEGWIGTALFYRTTRRLNLTEVGRSFYERTKDILLDLEEARVVAAQLEDHPSGPIGLTAPASMQHHLTGAVGDFQARWPGVTFSLSFTDRMVDMIGEGFDVAVRMGQQKDSTFRIRKIGEACRILCASPHYLVAAGTPEHPTDLANHSCLTFRTSPGYNVWSFRVGKKTVDVRASGTITADSGEALIGAARRGLGLVLGPEWLVGRSLASGELVEVLPSFPPNPNRTPLYAVHPYQRFVPPKVKTLVDFLAARFGSDYDWSGEG